MFEFGAQKNRENAGSQTYRIRLIGENHSFGERASEIVMFQTCTIWRFCILIDSLILMTSGCVDFLEKEFFAPKKIAK